MRTHSTARVSWIVVFFLVACGVAFAEVPAKKVIHPLDIPEGAEGFALGINNRGMIVGWFQDPPGSATQGFVLLKRFLTIIGNGTVPNGVNNLGEIVGTAQSTAFLLSRGAFTNFRVPGSASTTPHDINNRGDIVGFYSNPQFHGFLLSNGNFTTIDAPVPGTFATVATGINQRGEIVGYFSTPTQTRGFRWLRGRFTPVDVPNSGSTVINDINNRGQIVGWFNDASGEHGFVLSGNRFTTIHIPDSFATHVEAINDHGRIVGWHVTAGAIVNFEAHISAFTD